MKDGDKFLADLKVKAQKREAIAVFFYHAYRPPWWYWEDYKRCSCN